MVPVKDTNGSTSNGDIPTSTSLASNLTSLTKSLQSHWSSCCPESSGTPSRNGPTPPRSPATPSLYTYSVSGQVDTVLAMLRVASRIHEVQVDTETKDLMTGCFSSLETSLESLETRIESSSQELLERGEIFAHVVWVLESVGLCAILCGVVVSLLRGGGGAKGTKKGKKGKSAVQQQFSGLADSYTNMLTKIQDVASKLLVLTEKLETSISTDSLSNKMSGLSVDVDDTLEKEAGEVIKQMEKSFTESFYQIKTIVKNKQNYLG